jgi:hypothetical protein
MQAEGVAMSAENAATQEQVADIAAERWLAVEATVAEEASAAGAAHTSAAVVAVDPGVAAEVGAKGIPE